MKNVLIITTLILYNVSALSLEIPVVTSKNVQNNRYTLKINKSNSNISKGTSHGSGRIEYLNYSLKNILYELMDFPKQQIIFKGNMNNPKLDVLFQSEHLTNQQGSKIILDSLQTQFNFTISQKTIQKKVYTLKLIEPSRLNKHKSDQNSGIKSYEKNTNKQWEGKQVSIEQFKEVIREKIDAVVVNEIESKGKYNFSLPTYSVDVLKKSLKNSYGIDLKQDTRAIEMKIIEF